MNTERGFTLIELMITLAVATLLVAVAIPGFNQTIKDNRLVAQANELVSSMNLARSEAVKFGRTATICVSSNEDSCTGGTNWAQGWLVWVDMNNDGILDAGEERKVSKALPASMTYTGNTTQVQYSAQGAADGNWTFNLCDDRANETGRQISISNTGRANVAELSPCA